MLKFLACLASEWVPAILAGSTGPSSWNTAVVDGGLREYFNAKEQAQGKTCTKNQKCWANQFTSNWPGSSVKNLQCNLDIENPGWCECKSGFMDADDDPKTGCELTIEESVCAYGTCANHGVSLGDTCGNWGSLLKCEIDGINECCVLQQNDISTLACAADAECNNGLGTEDGFCDASGFCACGTGLTFNPIDLDCVPYYSNPCSLLPCPADSECSRFETDSWIGNTIDYQCVCNNPDDNYDYSDHTCKDASSMTQRGIETCSCPADADCIWSAALSTWTCDCQTAGTGWDPTTLSCTATGCEQILTEEGYAVCPSGSSCMTSVDDGTGTRHVTCGCDDTTLIFNTNTWTCEHTALASCDGNPCPQGSYCTDTPNTADASVPGGIVNHQCSCFNGNTYDFNTQTCAAGCVCPGTTKCYTVEESLFGGNDWEACECDSADKYYDYNTQTCVNFLSTCNNGDMCGSGTDSGTCSGITRAPYLPVETLAHKNTWDCNCATTGYVFNENTKLCQCDTFNSRDNACVRYNNDPCEASPCGEVATCTTLAVADQTHIVNSVYIDYECTCPTGQVFDYTNGECQPDTDPLQCNCPNLGTDTKCVTMPDGKGYYCQCLGFLGVYNKQLQMCVSDHCIMHPYDPCPDASCHAYPDESLGCTCNDDSLGDFDTSSWECPSSLTTINPDIIDDLVDIVGTNGVGTYANGDNDQPLTENLSIGEVELIVIAPKNSTNARFFSGFTYDEALAKCGLFGAHLPILGNDNDKQVMWNFMQMVKPSDSYWLHYETDALYDDPFRDQFEDPTKWSVKYSGSTRQGDRACTAWTYNNDLGQVWFDQNQCKILEADCNDASSYTTICMKIPAAYTLPAIPCPEQTELHVGECWSGNWTQWYNNILTNDETVEYHRLNSGLTCHAVSSVDVEIVGFAEETYTTQDVEIDQFTGFRCNDAQNPLGCYDYRVRFCCEGCCPKLNVSGDPELTDYYENYPGIYELITDDTFNGQSYYRQIAGYDEVGDVIYAEGHIYYWGDVGWLLGANMFTYSYYSDGIGEQCPENAPMHWINEVFGTQITVECVPVFPSCNDVECVENAYCIMTDDGPECRCNDGYTMFEDGKCLTSTPDPVVTDGECSGYGVVWSDYMNSDNPNNAGDWELLENFDNLCEIPVAIEAVRVDQTNTDPQLVHIEAETGFWCINSEQDGGGTCTDWKVRFCCQKWVTSECNADGYSWSTWNNRDSASDAGDFETISSYSDGDVCSSPIGVEARVRTGSSGSSAVTHIDNIEGFWCVNEEQPNGQACADFEARFCCPAPVRDEFNITYIMDGSCDDVTYGWSGWMNAGMPNETDADGDYETIERFARILTCDNPTGVQARTIQHPYADEQLVHIHKDAGFWCKNEENPTYGGCFDWEVRFCCPRTRTGECNEPHHTWTGWYNDEWNKKNERLWVSSREESEELIQYGDGAACGAPTAAEIRVRPTGSSSFQQTMAVYAKNLYDHLTPTSYKCVNEEQADGYKCVDMEIRYCCPDQAKIGTCDEEGYEWTQYYNQDTPSDTGDWETIANYSPGQVCRNPIAIQANNVDGGSAEFTHVDLTLGFYCINDEQSTGQCGDFEVRYCCPKMQVGECDKKGYEWTTFLSRDTPSDTGDWELLSAFEPNEVCASPTGAKVQDIGGDGGSISNYYLGLDGYYCLNNEQANGELCSDMAISFCCPTDAVETCETIQCGANEWCHETVDGPRCECGDDDFNIDWDTEDYVRGEDGECMPLVAPASQKVNDSCIIEVGHCNTFGHVWSDLINTDQPFTDDGDFEMLKNLNNLQGCSNPTGLRAIAADNTAYGSWPVHIDLNLGFWCLNSEQTHASGICQDFSIQVCCPETATGDCNQPGYNWTEFYDNDNPDGMGDWEARSDTMCEAPTAIQVQTKDGTAFNTFTHIDTSLGFWCLNEENQGIEACKDYEVSFCCPTTSVGQCTAYGHAWTSYYDLDDPVDFGDVETLPNFSDDQVCEAPTAVRAREFNTTSLIGDPFTRISVGEGFVCENDAFNTCSDWEVSFCCPKWGAGNDMHCETKGYEWTDWLNHDAPDNSLTTGDWETINSFGERKVCSSPTAVQAYPLDRTAGSTLNTHIDESIGFWCINDEQPNGLCADFAVRFCCPKYQEGSCEEDDHEWTDWLDRDDPIGDGDYENRHAFPDVDVCNNPTSIDARARSSGSTAVTHIDLYHGFWCLNDEQPNGEGCADFEVRFCCPKKEIDACEGDDMRWTVWLDSDDPVDSGDWENRDSFPANVVCQTPTAMQAQVKSGSTGSTEVVHRSTEHGFWCINDEQPKDQECADFEVRFCCSVDYYDPCLQYNMTCPSDSHIVYDVAADSCDCECDTGFNNSTLGVCEYDDSCDPSPDRCIDFAKCVNMNGFINIVGDADCVEASCTSGYTGSDPETDGFGYEVSCTEVGSTLGANGASTAFIACNCDGKTDCKWESDDLPGPLTEDGVCPSDSACPVSPWNDFSSEYDPSRNRFINDPLHNTLQADLYDNTKAEVLGRIQTSAVPAYSGWDWANGHYLVIVWEQSLPSHVTITPYGDYYDPAVTDYGDGTVQVFETFTDHMNLRDGSTRDTKNLDIVLDIAHNYELSFEDINELLNFRIATIPKTWTDAYGDTVSATASEVSSCLNAMLDNVGAAVNLRSWRENRTAIKRKQKRERNN